MTKPFDDRERVFDIDCERALELLPRYADDELTEAQAAPLRRHLMACVTCRGVASEQRGLARWFEPERAGVGPAIDVPAGFAARVAAAAFAGTAGRAPEPHGAVEPRPARRPGPRPVAEAGGVRDFVLAATAAAAVALFALSVAIGMRDRPRGETLSATEVPELLRMLDSSRAGEPIVPVAAERTSFGAEAQSDPDADVEEASEDAAEGWERRR